MRARGKGSSPGRVEGSSRAMLATARLSCSSCSQQPIYATVAEGEVTSKELVMNVRQSGQWSSTAKQPLHMHACLHGSSARSTADD